MLASQPQRDGSNCFHIGGNLIANYSIPAGRAANQEPLFVGEGDSDSVNFGFHHIRQLAGGGLFLNPLFPFLQFLLIETVFKREHGAGMAHLWKIPGGRPPNPLSGGIGDDKFRMLLLYCF